MSGPFVQLKSRIPSRSLTSPDSFPCSALEKVSLNTVTAVGIFLVTGMNEPLTTPAEPVSYSISNTFKDNVSALSKDFDFIEVKDRSLVNTYLSSRPFLVPKLFQILPKIKSLNYSDLKVICTVKRDIEEDYDYMVLKVRSSNYNDDFKEKLENLFIDAIETDSISTNDLLVTTDFVKSNGV